LNYSFGFTISDVRLLALLTERSPQTGTSPQLVRKLLDLVADRLPDVRDPRQDLDEYRHDQETEGHDLATNEIPGGPEINLVGPDHVTADPGLGIEDLGREM